MDSLEAAGDDAHAVAIQKERARKTGCLGRHGVGARVVKNLRRRPDADWISKRQFLGSNTKRPQSSTILIDPCRRRNTGGTTWPIMVGLMEPLTKLVEQIRLVVKAPLFEERSLDPSDQVFDRALLFGTVRPAELHAKPQLEHRRGERGVPLGDGAVLAPLVGNRARPIEDRQQRNAAEG